MKANEIRVGNWLNDPRQYDPKFFPKTENGYFQATARDIQYAEEFEPIPLTELILMENNFIIDDCKGFDTSDDDYYKVYSFNGFDIAFIEETFYVWHELEDSYCNFYIHNKIEFVHQLQNAYFTNKGEELEINL